MSNDPDWAEQKVAQLLPCFDDGCVKGAHSVLCPVRFRPRIAVALRDALDEGASTQAKLEVAGRDRFIASKRTEIEAEGFNRAIVKARRVVKGAANELEVDLRLKTMLAPK